MKSISTNRKYSSHNSDGGRGNVQKTTVLNMKRYLNEIQVSEMTGYALSSLRNARSLGTGIPYIKDGRNVRYDYDDVVAHMESRKVATDNG